MSMTGSKGRRFGLVALASTMAALVLSGASLGPGASHAASAAAASTAIYELVFDATWSAQTHPTDFPSGPHFSGLIGGTHQGGVTFWEVGGIATDGIESMAELGGKTQLQSEVEAAIRQGLADQVISGPGISTSPGSASVTFTATEAFPLATVVAMVAPSPDWFVGVSGVSLRTGNSWVEELVISLEPYDADTDSGETYTSPDVDLTPREPISVITGPPLSSIRSVAPLGTFTFSRVSVQVEPDSFTDDPPWFQGQRSSRGCISRRFETGSQPYGFCEACPRSPGRIRS